jgi:hypothetical protein
MSWRAIERELVDFFRKEGFDVWSDGGDQKTGISWADEFGEESIRTANLSKLAQCLADSLMTRKEKETMHLMRSPANARRLDEAIADIATNKVVKRDL